MSQSSPMAPPGPPETEEPLSPLEREEYVEQHHFFTVLGERLAENVPAQEVLALVREEILATTKLPMAIDFLLAELRHQGVFAAGMKKLGHYFTPFQCYVISEAEHDRRRFDLRIALEILAREAKYRAEPGISRQGLFLYHFEALCRNRLGYDPGLEAMAQDPSFDGPWRDWILTVRRQIGIVELADLIYVRSEYYHQRLMADEDPQRAERSPATDENTQRAVQSPATDENTQRAVQSPATASGGEDGGEDAPGEDAPDPLFGLREGRIAWANRLKDPLVLFAALQRHLGYPPVPRTKTADPEERLLPVLARRVEQLESRLKLLEEEQRGGIQLERFYVRQEPEAPAGPS
ncbi:MAG: hypothetical protein IH831_07050 [Planctomycetes bacterium]|nr:hypothetical protein [Planctomycetota bacterium]